jgi:hypothetical protein
MSVRLRHLTAILGAGVALAGAGCGSDDSSGPGIPADAVAALDERLDEIARRFQDATDDTVNVGACNDIQNDSFRAIADTLDGLPDDVDPDVREALDESFRHLQDLTQEGCTGLEQPETDTETTPTETIPEVTETETVPSDQTETQTTPEQPDQGNGNSGGNGKGNGNGRGNGGTGSGQGGGVQAPGN